MVKSCQDLPFCGLELVLLDSSLVAVIERGQLACSGDRDRATLSIRFTSRVRVPRNLNFG